LLQNLVANQPSEEPVKNRCESQGEYRFKVVLPEQQAFENSGHTLFFETDVDGVIEPAFTRSNYVVPDFPATRLRGYIDGLIETNGAYFLHGWACQTNVESSVTFSLLTRKDGEFVLLGKDLPANTSSGGSVATACNTKMGRHAFRARIPETAIDDFANGRLFVQAHSAFGGTKLMLPRSHRYAIPSTLPTLMPTGTPPNVIVFFTDDQGYADLGVQDVLDDVKTPNIDALAHNGVRFTNGYVTASQCSPSRAAFLTGRYQQRFGLDENRQIPMTLDETTIAQRFKQQDYATGMFGKWHLEIMGNSVEWGRRNYPDLQPFKVDQIPEEVRHQYFPHQRGFDDMLAGYTNTYLRNVDDRGRTIALETHRTDQFRIDLTSDASLAFIDKNWQKPFFMYVSHYGPHVPIEATQHYLDRFSEDMPMRRRYALAMMAAIDDGVGRVVDKLKNYNVYDNTIIMFISDNGAPLGDDMTDAPLSAKGEAWNGSRNDPFTGEKGMLTEGAVRVPFIVQWPNKISAGMELDTPVSALDAAYTALKVAGDTQLDALDGLDLMPLIINGDSNLFDQRPLFWRFFFQRAIRKGDWKYMQAGIRREYLFDMTQTEPESINLINTYPDIAKELRDEYWQWAAQMQRPEELVELPPPFAERVDRYLPLPLP